MAFLCLSLASFLEMKHFGEVPFCTDIPLNHTSFSGELLQSAAHILSAAMLATLRW